MLIKWLGAFFQHGLISVFALLAALAAVWWVEPTTNGGIAFLLFIVFLVALTVFELLRKLVLQFMPTATAVADPPPPATDAPPADATGARPTAAASDADDQPARVSRSRRRPRARR